MSYLKNAQSAKRMIDKSGRSVTFIKKSRTPNDPSKPWSASNGADEEFKTKCVFVDYEVNEIDGEKIKVGDKKLLANALDNKNEIVEDYQFVQDRDTKWRIKSVKPFEPGDTIIFYEIQLRK